MMCHHVRKQLIGERNHVLSLPLSQSDTHQGAMENCDGGEDNVR